jgi:hypothetical protein
LALILGSPVVADHIKHKPDELRDSP